MPTKQELFEQETLRKVQMREQQRRKEREIMSKTHDYIDPSIQDRFGGSEWIPKDPTKRREFLKKYEQ